MPEELACPITGNTFALVGQAIRLAGIKLLCCSVRGTCLWFRCIELCQLRSKELCLLQLFSLMQGHWAPALPWHARPCHALENTAQSSESPAMMVLQASRQDQNVK